MDLSGLNPAQKQVVEHGSGPVLVVAGAGTGKTHVLTMRVAYLAIERKVPVDQILALTFTDKAAREMEERVDKLLPYGMLETRIMTFHSFGERILKEFGHDLGLPINMNLMSKAQQMVFLRQNLDNLELDYYAPIGDPASYLGSLASYFSRLSDELVSESKYDEFIKKLKNHSQDEADEVDSSRHQELLRAYRHYRRLKSEAGLVDYDDLISLVVELFDQKPNVLREVQQSIEHILVDEFQDTNRSQNRLLQQLAGPKGNLMVVGDDDQSIYRFRGAAVANILEFTDFYQDVTTIVLTENYRSSQQILDNAYRLIQHNNPDRLEPQQQINKYLTARTSGPEPQVWVLPTYSLEADALAIDIKRRLDEGQPASSIAVLLRKKNQADILAPALRRHNVEYRLADQLSLFEHPEVAILLQVLQVVVDPLDSGSLYHVMVSNLFGFDLSFLMEQASLARRRNLTLEAQLRQSEPVGETADRLDSFFELLEAWRRRSSELTAGQLLFEICERTGYINDYVKRSQSDAVAVLAVQNISRLFASIAEFERVATDKSAIGWGAVAESLREAGESPEAVEQEVAPSEIQLMTIHKAKGLEFETVYLFDLIKGSFPGSNRREAISLPSELAGELGVQPGERHLQEERRLMYVAMTRAKTNLIMTYSPDHGGKLRRKPSPFIEEALGQPAPELIEENKVAIIQQELELFRPTGRKASYSAPEHIFLTPHQIDDYLSCPANFHFRHIMKVPEPPAPALMYGTLIHEAINRYFQMRSKGGVSEKDLLLLVDKLWASDGFISVGQEQKRREQAVATIKAFIKRQDTQKDLPISTERSFEFNIDDINTTVRGRIDAIFQVGESIEIRDYKTSPIDDVKKADAKAKGSVQLAVYALAWRQMTGVVPDRTVLDYVETGVEGVYQPAAGDLEHTLKQIRQVAAGIRSGSFQPSGNCFYCSHPKEVKVAA
ncbi:MAG TPA: ATP-dependent DNA helicase [Candidatus Saccharimonadales bacterium]|nr:ATP-dependent DNA helicase [Candidatus Saccharimonadales bacterium]